MSYNNEPRVFIKIDLKLENEYYDKIEKKYNFEINYNSDELTDLHIMFINQYITMKLNNLLKTFKYLILDYINVTPYINEKKVQVDIIFK